MKDIAKQIISTIIGGLLLALLLQQPAPAPSPVLNQPAIILVQSLHQVAQALV